MTSVVFPGQGSQFPGMAKDFHDNFKIAKLIFEQIEDYSKINLRNIIFNEDERQLNLTKYTQISIFASSYIMYKTFIEETDFQIDKINVMLGHSLGEYTALACSNKLNLKDCCLILKKRGELMNDAVHPNTTKMAALIGKDSDHIQSIIKDKQLDVEIANDNSPMQIVISGSEDAITKSKDIFLSNKIKKFVLLNVSSAFHSKFMLEAQKKLSEDIAKLKFSETNIKIISNYDANIYNDTENIRNNLQYQMANKVNWTKSIEKLEQIGETKIIEIGPSKVLSGLIVRISKNFDIHSINKISDFKK